MYTKIMKSYKNWSVPLHMPDSPIRYRRTGLSGIWRGTESIGAQDIATALQTHEKVLNENSE